ncbi:type IV toxin-antitoxin system AbiEi family antitoxin domain-containing protein [Bacillus cereus]|nr:type IV toxin-antitoxin system AbiEi family antitoxin domain-containing protein [Bacillus cereus]
MSDVYILQKFDKREFAKNEILFTAEAIEILGISRSRMNMLLKKGQLEPIRRTTGVNLFLRDDIMNKKEELTRKRKQYGYRND